MNSMQPAAGRPVISTVRRRHGRCFARDAVAVAAAVAIGLGVVPGVVPMAGAHHEEQALRPQLAQAAGAVPLADALIGKWDIWDGDCTESFDEYRADGTMRIAYRTGDRWDISALRPVGRYSLDGALLTTITDRPDGGVVETVVQTIRIDPDGQLVRHDHSRTRANSETGETIDLETRSDAVARCPAASTAGADDQLDRSLVALKKQVAAARAFAAGHPEAVALRDSLIEYLSAIPGLGTGWYRFDDIAGYMLPLAETENGYRLVLPALDAASEDSVEIGTITVDFAPRADGQFDMAVALPEEISIETGNPEALKRIGILLGETTVSGIWDLTLKSFFDLDARFGAVVVAVNGRQAARFGTVSLISDSEMTAVDQLTSASELSVSDIDAMGTLLIDRIAVRSSVEDVALSAIVRSQDVAARLLRRGLDSVMSDMNTPDRRRTLADDLDILMGSIGLWQSDLSIDGIRIAADGFMAGPAAGWSIGSINVALDNALAEDDAFGELSTWLLRFGMDAVQANPQSLPPDLMRLVPRRLGFSVAIERLPVQSIINVMVATLRQNTGGLALGRMTSLLLRARSGVRLRDIVLDAPDAGIEGEAVVSLDPDNPNLGGGNIDLEIRGLDTMTETARAMGASKEQLTVIGLLTALGLPMADRSGDYRYVVTLNGLQSVLVNDRDISPLLNAMKDM